MRYEHVDKNGDVTEIVVPATERNNVQLAAKADDPESGWRRVVEAPPAVPVRPAPAPARGRAAETSTTE